MVYVCVLLIFVLFAGIAMTVGEGIWNNTINLLCILVSGTLATSIGIYLGFWAYEQADVSEASLWYFTFAGFWIVFFISMLLMRLLADKLSRTRMRFIPQLEMVVGPLIGLLVAVIFTSILTNSIIAMPVKAGVWQKTDSESWDSKTMGYFSLPFLTIAKAFEDDDHPLIWD